MTIANKNTVIRRLLIGLCLGFLTLTAHAGIDITYIHNDALGSAVAGTDEQGNVKWRSQYAPYGEERLGERSAFGIRSGYTGHRDDPETGLTYMGGRYYSPAIGRFMGVDPAGVNASNIYSFNRYAYANNNPYKYVDPNGESPIEWIFIAGDIASATANVAAGNYGAAAWDIGNILLDLVGPPGASEASHLAKTARTVDKVSDATKRVTKRPSLRQENPRNLLPTQSRSEMSGSQVKRLAKDMKENGFDQSKPVDVSPNPNTGRLEIQDGHHRTEAAKKAGLDTIPVQVSE